MKNLLRRLEGGDRRSIGNSDEIAKEVGDDPNSFRALFAGLFKKNPVVQMRAADAAEKITRKHPELLQPCKETLLRNAAHISSKEVRWHIAQMLPRLRLSFAERKSVLRILRSYLEDESSIVKTSSMQSLWEVAEQDDRLVRQVVPIIMYCISTGTPAMKARGRKLEHEFWKTDAAQRSQRGHPSTHR